jgi:hypothetical protein
MHHKDIEIPMTTKQAAQALGLKPGTLEIWRVRGTGPTYLKIGGAVKYLPRDLGAFMLANRRTSTSEY